MTLNSTVTFTEGRRPSYARQETRVLTLTDDPQTREALRDSLAGGGFIVVERALAEGSLPANAKSQADLLIVDVDSANGRHCELLRRLDQEFAVPIIVVTGRAEEVQCIVALECGADDCVLKPFSSREIVARAHAVLRRAHRAERTEHEPHTIVIGDMTVDERSYEVRARGESLPLTRAAFRMLVALARNAGQVLSREQLAEIVHAGGSIDQRTVDRHINNLRKAIEPDPQHPRYVVTVFGFGYRMPREAVGSQGK